MKNGNSLSQGMIDFFPLVMIVEDDEDTRLMMKYLLKLWSYRIIEATNDEEAVQAADIYHPDMILISDIHNKNNGLTTIRRMRELSKVDEAVIIFITGYSGQSVHAAALAAGADDYMIKPIDFGQLETNLKNYLKKDYRLDKTSVRGNI